MGLLALSLFGVSNEVSGVVGTIAGSLGVLAAIFWLAATVMYALDPPYVSRTIIHYELLLVLLLLLSLPVVGINTWNLRGACGTLVALLGMVAASAIVTTAAIAVIRALSSAPDSQLYDPRTCSARGRSTGAVSLV